MRLKDKIAIVVGAGQSPGEGLGNGRATVLRFAQEGAKVMAVDNKLSSAEETVAMARQSGGECIAFEADVTKEATLAAMAEAAQRRWGFVIILCTQPLWFYMSWRNGQWAVALISIWYGINAIRGIRSHFFGGME